MLSRFAGSLIDRYPKLAVVRFLIASQKISSISAYCCCAIITASDPAPSSLFAFVTPSFLWLLFSACLLHFSNIAVSIAVERDWASSIAKTSLDSTADGQLAQLNTYLRQINLLCKLCAPLFVSMLTVKLDSSVPHTNLRAGMGLKNLRSIWVLIAVTALSLIFEIYWIEVVYRRFPSLALDQARKDAERAMHRASLSTTDQVSSQSTAAVTSAPSLIQGLCAYVEDLLSLRDWKELLRLPIFFSSASISCLYLTVLSCVIVSIISMTSYEP